MDRDTLIRAQHIIESIDRLYELKERMPAKFFKLTKDSSKEDIIEFFEFVEKADCLGIFVAAVLQVRNEIGDRIKQLEEELKEL